MVSPFDFKPYDAVADKLKYFESIIYNPGPAQSQLVAGLTLPHGAKITQLTLYFYDAHLPADMVLYLYRAAVNGVISVVTSITPTGLNTGINYLSTTKFSPGAEVIDNRNYSYFLLAFFPGSGSTNLGMTNARIDYAYTTNLPAVMN